MTKTRASGTAGEGVEHRLPSVLLQKRVRVTVVGCGGTGSAIAAGLPYLHQALLAWGHPYGLDVTLVDGDRISRANCVRQPFSESEIGLFKATVLATRINLFWGLGWKGIPHFMEEGWQEETDILIGCVDSRQARKILATTNAFQGTIYWLDIGNNADNGQFVLGQPENRRNQTISGRLLTVAELYPEIMDPRFDAKDQLPSCSAIEALERQEPFVNQVLAQHALAMLARLFHHGRLSYQGGFLNVATGRGACLPVTTQKMPQENSRLVSRYNLRPECAFN